MMFPVQVAGWWGLWTAAVAFYCGAADLLNEVWGRVLLPIGKVGNLHRPAFLRIAHPKEVTAELDMPEASHRLMADATTKVDNV